MPLKPDRRAFLAAAAGAAVPSSAAWTIRQQIGTNCFNEQVTPAWMDAAQAAGIRLVRLAYDKWAPRDFLLGSADQYRGLVPAHLRQLVATLDAFAQRKLQAIVVPLSLPGARWRQQNGGKRDGRLWRDRQFWDQSQVFWKDLATALKGHPAVAALDILNEPAPELEWGKSSFWQGRPYPDWQSTVHGTAGDLNGFYRHVIAGVRASGTTIPVIVESGLFATPWAMSALEPLPASAGEVLYSFHMYEPYEYTTWRKHRGALKYPGPVRIEDTGATIGATPEWLDRFFDPVRAWMRQHGVPPHQILVGEFGVGRRSPGAARYLADLIRIFDRQGWHWLFYTFREDTWDGMDYELGSAPPPEWYWKPGGPQRQAELYTAARSREIWSVLRERLNR